MGGCESVCQQALHGCSYDSVKCFVHVAGSQSPAKKLATINTPVDENELTLTFHEWLASVTDRINQSMHYQFDGSDLFLFCWLYERKR